MQYLISTVFFMIGVFSFATSQTINNVPITLLNILLAFGTISGFIFGVIFLKD